MYAASLEKLRARRQEPRGGMYQAISREGAEGECADDARACSLQFAHKAAGGARRDNK
jgi:hypothetical protein